MFPNEGFVFFLFLVESWLLTDFGLNKGLFLECSGCRRAPCSTRGGGCSSPSPPTAGPCPQAPFLLAAPGRLLSGPCPPTPPPPGISSRTFHGRVLWAAGGGPQTCSANCWHFFKFSELPSCQQRVVQLWDRLSLQMSRTYTWCSHTRFPRK